MSTPDPRRGDEPGDPVTPAPSPENHSEPGDEPAIEPVGPNDPEPDVNDGEAPQPMSGDDDLADERDVPLARYGSPE